MLWITSDFVEWMIDNPLWADVFVVGIILWIVAESILGWIRLVTPK